VNLKFYVIDNVHVFTINIPHNILTLWFTVYGIYQLRHVSALRAATCSTWYMPQMVYHRARILDDILKVNINSVVIF